MSVSSQDSMEINHYDLDPIEEFEQLFGPINHYGIDDIYKLVYKKMKWPVLEVIELFESLRDEYVKEVLYEDDYEVRSIVKIRTESIDNIIEFLETELR